MLESAPARILSVLTMLELSLLGSAQLRLSGVLLHLKTRKALVMVALLALEGAASRDRLAALFWADAENARNSLRNALSHLREVFVTHIETDRLTVRLIVNTCDALKVLRGDEAAALEYSGDLLDGLTLPDAPEADEWLSSARQRVRLAAVRTLERLGTVAALEKLIELDSLNESAQRRLIEGLAGSGQRDRALEVFEVFRARLQIELGVLPMPETLALADSLRLVEPAKSPRGRGPSLPSLLLESRLIGRVPEFQRLVAGFHAATQQQPSAIVLSGEPGIGKTRLAHEFLVWAQARGAVILQARAFEGGGLAYQSISDALRFVPALETLLAPVWLSALGRILPELYELPNLPAPVSDEGLGRSRVFEAVSKLTEAIAQRGTLIWLLDDAQWADAASLEVLSFVTRRAAFAGLPVLFVLTARTEGLSNLQAWLASVQREIPLARLEVEALSKDDTARLLEGLGLPLEPLLERLYAETGGQPLFLSETLRSLSETGALTNTGSAWQVQLQADIGVAPGVRDVIRARFSRVSADALALLEAGAVLGQGFTLDDAVRVAALSDGLAALEELLRLRVLLEVRGTLTEATLYTFSHDKLRETALAGLSAAKAEYLHRLALTRTQGSAAQRAIHALTARDWTLAVRFSLEAAEQASHSYAWRDALDHLERGRSVLTSRPAGSQASLELTQREVMQLYGRLVQHLRILGENTDEPYLQLASEALQLSKERSDPQLEAVALLFQESALSFDEARSLALLEQVEQILRDLGDQAGLFELEVRRAFFTRLHPETINDAIAHLERLIPRAAALGRDQLAWVYSSLADFHQSSGDWGVAVNYWNEDALQEYAVMSDDAAYRMENLAFSMTNIGDLTAALHAGREAYRIKQAIDTNPMWIGMAGVFLSYALVETAAVDEALLITTKAHALRADAILRFAAEYTFAYANAQLERDPQQAQTALLETYAQFIDGVPINSSYNHFIQPFELGTFADFYESHLCSAAALMGDWKGAAQHARNALRLRDSSRNWRGLHAPRLRHWLEVTALLKDGDAATAQHLVQTLAQHVSADEPLAINLALAQHALDGSSVDDALRLAEQRGWTWRVAQLEAARHS